MQNLSTSSNRSCAIHTGIRKTMFCNDCDMSMCFLCQSSSQHMEHRFSYLKSLDCPLVISTQKVRDTIKKREEIKLKFKKDINENKKAISSQIETHGKKLINKFSLMVNKRVNSLVDYVKELGENALHSFDEVTDTFKALLETQQNSEDKKTDINVYNRDLLTHFLTEKFENNLEFVPGKCCMMLYDLANFGHFEIDGNVCTAFTADKDNSKNSNDMDFDSEQMKEPSLKRRRHNDDDEQDNGDKCKQRESTSRQVSTQDVQEKSNENIAQQQIQSQINLQNQLKDAANGEVFKEKSTSYKKICEIISVESCSAFSEPEPEPVRIGDLLSFNPSTGLAVTSTTTVTTPTQNNIEDTVSNSHDGRSFILVNDYKEKEKDIQRYNEKEDIDQGNMKAIVIEEIKTSATSIGFEEFVERIYQRVAGHVKEQDINAKLEAKKKIVDNIRSIAPDFKYI